MPCCELLVTNAKCYSAEVQKGRQKLAFETDEHHNMKVGLLYFTGTSFEL